MTTPPGCFVTHRCVGVDERIIATAREKLHEFQVEVAQTKWAKQKGLPVVRVELYKPPRTIDGQSYILFPRFKLLGLMQQWGSLIRPVHRVPNRQPTMPLVLLPNFEPTDVQDRAATYVMERKYTEAIIAENRASCTIELDTGLGKTLLALEIFRRLCVAGRASRMLFITLTTGLREQAYGDFRSVVDVDATDAAVENPAFRYGPNTVTTDRTVDCRIAVMNIDAATRVADLSYFGFFYFVVFDEVPTFCTESRRKIFWYKGICTLGLTAEPNSRSDKLDPIFHAHLGSIIGPKEYEGPPENDIRCTLMQHNYRRAPQLPALKPIYNAATGYLSYLESIESCLIEDLARRDLIVQLSTRLLAQNARHFIFAHHVAHVRSIALACTAAMPNAAIFILADDGTTDPQGPQRIRAADIVVATYRASTYGISKPDAMAMILAAPPYGVDFKQLRGRIMRLNVTNPAMNDVVREIHSINDRGHYWLKRHYQHIADYYGDGTILNEGHFMPTPRQVDDAGFDD